MKSEAPCYRVNGQLYAHGWPLNESAIDKEMGLSGDAPSPHSAAQSNHVDNSNRHRNRAVPNLNYGNTPQVTPITRRNSQPGIEIIETGPDYLIYYDPHMDHLEGPSSPIQRSPQFPQVDRVILNPNPGDKPEPITGNNNAPQQLKPEIENIAPGIFIVRSRRNAQLHGMHNSARHRPDYPRGVRISPHVHNVYFGNAGMLGSGADGFPPFVDGLSSRTDRLVYASQFGSPGRLVISPRGSGRYPSSRRGDSLGGLAYSPTSPAYRSASPPSPAYDPASPPLDLMSRACSPTSPTYSPTSPKYRPSPAQSLGSPAYSPTSPVFSPASPHCYSRASPDYSLGSPQYSPTSPTGPIDWSPNSPQLGSPTSHFPGSPPPGMNEPSPFMLRSPQFLPRRQLHPLVDTDPELYPGLHEQFRLMQGSPQFGSGRLPPLPAHQSTDGNKSPPRDDSAPSQDTNPEFMTPRTSRNSEGFAANSPFSLPIRPRQLKKLDTSGLRIDTNNTTVNLSIPAKAMTPSLVEESMNGKTVLAPSVSKDGSIVEDVREDMPKVAPTLNAELSKVNGSGCVTPKDNNANENEQPKKVNSSPEDLGEGLANLGDWEEDLLDGEDWEYIVRK